MFVVSFGNVFLVIFVILVDNIGCVVLSADQDYIVLFIEGVFENFLEMDWYRIFEEFYVYFLNEFFYYFVGGLVSQVFLGLVGGCGRY